MTNELKARPKLNWLDKTIYALAEWSWDETRVMILSYRYCVLGMLFGFHFMLFLKSLVAFGVIESFLIDWLPYPKYTQFIALSALFSGLVLLGTHSVDEIEEADLSGRESWGYLALALFIMLSYPLWGLLMLGSLFV